MKDVFAPRRTDKAPEELSLTGKFIPYKGGEPCWLNMPKSPHTYLPCFDDDAQMRSVFERAGVDFDDVKRITNGPEFMVSIPHHIIIIANLRWTERGTLKFTQVLRD